jgi:hypothetical protein
MTFDGLPGGANSMKKSVPLLKRLMMGALRTFEGTGLWVMTDFD